MVESPLSLAMFLCPHYKAKETPLTYRRDPALFVESAGSPSGPLAFLSQRMHIYMY